MIFDILSFFVGVFKFQARKAGYPEVYDIALDLYNRDKGFTDILLRKVSADSWGIDFTYSTVKGNKKTIKEFSDYYKEFTNSGLTYACDYAGVSEEDVIIANGKLIANDINA
jgi:hypothetical protein